MWVVHVPWFSKLLIIYMKNAALIPWLMALGTSVILISTDIYAPMMPAMRAAFGASEAQIIWTITINSIGYCCISLFVGPLSDAIGRRLMCLVSLIAFATFSVSAGFSTSLNFFNWMRFGQGMVGSMLPILSLAVLSDCYSGRRLSSLMAYVGIAITLSFAIAPVIGGFIGEHYGWRAIFYFLGAASALSCATFFIWMPETIKAKKVFNSTEIIKTYKVMLSDRQFLLLGGITSFSLAGIFSYISSSSYLYIEQFKVSPQLFGLITGLTAAVNAISHTAVGRLVLRLGNFKTLALGISIQVTGVLLLVTMMLMCVYNIYALSIPLMMCSASLGFIFPTATSISLERYTGATGAASAMLGTLRMGMLAFGAWVAGKAYDGTLSSVVSVSALFYALVFICFLRCLKYIRYTT